MSFSRRCIRAVNSFVSLVVALVLLTAGAYSVYALWDNRQVYSAAHDVQLQMQELKPVAETAEEGGPSFADLLAVNPDVRAWLTMDGTAIDYPILQGDTNLSYINTDVYGDFALAGSLFLDCRNRPDFSDGYNVIFGHHMANSHMFGDLDLYREEKFFRENDTGTLMTAEGFFDLTVIAVLVVPAAEDRIFDEPQDQNADAVLAWVREHAMLLRSGAPLPGDESHLLALTTCASDYTDARTIVITIMSDIHAFTGGNAE